ncbi:MAG: SDR family oxidoreductase [Chloroflexi bacterium]|nr:SDR family oxidoreductase [Chloroflexota bacterium]
MPRRGAGGGRLDILYNNVGGGFFRQGEGSSIQEMGLAFWEQTIGNNLRSTFLCSKLAVPHLTQQGGGVIINVAADYRVRQLGTVAYGAAKNGIIGFTQNLARELWPQNIRAHCICPGLIRMPLPDDPIRPHVEGGLTRRGAPEDIAFAALYLASDEASWLTGVILNVGGGNEVLAFDRQ